VVIKFEQVFSSSPFADFFFFSKFIILKWNVVHSAYDARILILTRWHR
jgi:hypothetical protein